MTLDGNTPPPTVAPIEAKTPAALFGTAALPEQQAFLGFLVTLTGGPASSGARPCKTPGCPNKTEVVEIEPRIPTPWLDARDAITASMASYCEPCVLRIQEAEKSKSSRTERAHQMSSRSAFWERVWGGKSSHYHATSISRLPAPAAASNVLRWKVTLDKGVLLHGNTGSGKTRTVYLLLKDILMTLGIYPTIKKCAMLRSEIIAAAMDSEAARQALLSKLVNCKLLYLDDLGQMAKSDPCEEFMFNLVEERTNLGLPIIATTQHTGDSFAKNFNQPLRGAAIIRRLGEACYKVAFTRPKNATTATTSNNDTIP